MTQVMLELWRLILLIHTLNWYWISSEITEYRATVECSLYCFNTMPTKHTHQWIVMNLFLFMCIAYSTLRACSRALRFADMTAKHVILFEFKYVISNRGVAQIEYLSDWKYRLRWRAACMTIRRQYFLNCCHVADQLNIYIYRVLMLITVRWDICVCVCCGHCSLGHHEERIS